MIVDFVKREYRSYWYSGGSNNWKKHEWKSTFNHLIDVVRLNTSCSRMFSLATNSFLRWELLRCRFFWDTKYKEFLSNEYYSSGFSILKIIADVQFYVIFWWTKWEERINNRYFFYYSPKVLFCSRFSTYSSVTADIDNSRVARWLYSGSIRLLVLPEFLDGWQKNSITIAS